MKTRSAYGVSRRGLAAPPQLPARSSQACAVMLLAASPRACRVSEYSQYPTEDALSYRRSGRCAACRAAVSLPPRAVQRPPSRPVPRPPRHIGLSNFPSGKQNPPIEYRGSVMHLSVASVNLVLPTRLGISFSCVSTGCSHPNVSFKSTRGQGELRPPVAER